MPITGGYDISISYKQYGKAGPSDITSLMLLWKKIKLWPKTTQFLSEINQKPMENPLKNHHRNSKSNVTERTAITHLKTHKHPNIPNQHLHLLSIHLFWAYYNSLNLNKGEFLARNHSVTFHPPFTNWGNFPTLQGLGGRISIISTAPWNLTNTGFKKTI